MKFDMVDYRRRQRNIRRITIGSLIVAILSFLVVGFSWIRDPNTQTLLEFICLSSGLVVLAGLYATFLAWYEKKVMLFKEKIEKRNG